jgi:addiction module HigA family antidote
VAERYEFEPNRFLRPGQLIAQVLADQGMTQSDLARRSHVSGKHISYLVNGKARITAPIAVKIEKALNVEFAHVLMRLQADLDVSGERGSIPPRRSHTTTKEKP